MIKKVLVVDDSASIRDQVRRVLEGAGCTVAEASDGQKGLDAIRAQRDFALVICDVQMPNLSGLEMVELLHAEGLMSGLAVVMLTTEAQPALVERAKKAGAKGSIVKPFKEEHIVAVVRKLTR